MRGGEKVLENLCKLYPDADIFTHVYNPLKISNLIKSHKIKTTFIDRLPFSKKYYPYYLPLMPLALKLLNLKSYDLIISSESGPSKGISKGKNSIHLCYCHTPMRYIWDMKDDYIKHFNYIVCFFLRLFSNIMKRWDLSSSKNIDQIIANSTFVAARIKKYWKQDSIVVHPPIHLEQYKINNEKKTFYLIVSHLVSYKKIDLAIKVFNEIDEKLVIIGTGPLLNKLKKIAKGNIEFLGWVSDSLKIEYMSKCKALIFPGIEDFGLVPIETMACGRPVIAYKEGGALDYIEENINGIFFKKQDTTELLEKIKYFELNKDTFDSILIQKTVSKFNSIIFRNKIEKIINESLLKLNGNN